MSAPKYKNPETGEERTAAEWSKKLGISRNAFILRCRVNGKDNPKSFKVGRGYDGVHGTKEFQELDDTEKSIKPLNIKVGTWEAENISRQPRREKLIPLGKPSPNEKVVLDAAAKIEGSFRPGDLAGIVGRPRGWVGKNLAKLAKKRLVRRLDFGVYEAGSQV